MKVLLRRLTLLIIINLLGVSLSSCDNDPVDPGDPDFVRPTGPGVAELAGTWKWEKTRITSPSGTQTDSIFVGDTTTVFQTVFEINDSSFVILIKQVVHDQTLTLNPDTTYELTFSATTLIVDGGTGQILNTEDVTTTLSGFMDFLDYKYINVIKSGGIIIGVPDSAATLIGIYELGDFDYTGTHLILEGQTQWDFSGAGVFVLASAEVFYRRQ